MAELTELHGDKYGKLRVVENCALMIYGSFLALLATGCAQQGQHEDRYQAPPNIVFFFVDDMGWQDTSVPFHTEVTALNEKYHTPNMEQLAAEGVKFTQAYAASLCSPSRVSLMTGMNAARHRVTNWTLEKGKSPDLESPSIIPPDWNVNGLGNDADESHSVSVDTLPQLLKKAGYRTIHVGKAHFGAKGTSGANPVNLGFDVNIAGHAAGAPGSYLGEHNYSALHRGERRIWDVPGLEKYHGTDTYLAEALTIEANQAVEEAVAENTPFYLYMSHYSIHSPWEKDARFYQKYLDKGLSEFDAVYASMIESMDKSLGDIMKNLEVLEVAENTIIVFMSDNGATVQVSPNRPLRGHKISPYEGGIRVPMLVKWPGTTAPGTSNDHYLIIEDIFPTFLELANLKEDAQKSRDGISFVPLLSNQNAYQANRALYWHFPHTYYQTPYSVVRQGDWKLIYHHANRKMELFNLAQDIGEQSDLFAENPAKVQELAGLLSSYLEETNALMPVDKTTGNPVEYPIDALRTRP